LIFCLFCVEIILKGAELKKTIRVMLNDPSSVAVALLLRRVEAKNLADEKEHRVSRTEGNLK